MGSPRWRLTAAVAPLAWLTRRRGATSARPGIACLVGVLLLAGCGGCAGMPPLPDRSLVPETIGLADRWEDLACDTIRFTLRSGDAVDIVRGTAHTVGCPDQTPTPALVYGSHYATNGAASDGRWTSGAPLILAGNDGDRGWWAGVLTDGSGCWLVRFAKGEGAYLEGDSLHFSNGLVLPLADDFRRPIYPSDPFPLRRDDSLCLDESGRVVSVVIWIPY